MRQRIVGAVVLLCLAIIFVPLLLDGEGLNAPELEVIVPPVPEPQPAELPSAFPPGALPTPELPAPETALPETPSADETAPVAQNDAERPEESTRPGHDEEGLLEGWSVRLGSFGNASNADDLMARLRENGYRPYTRILRRNPEPLTGVFVGPVLTRAEAVRLRDELEDGYRLDGMVVEFSIATGTE